MRLKAYVETPEQAWSAHRLGLQGIYRMEAALLAPDRIGLMRSVVIAEDTAARQDAIEKLLPLHKADLKAILRIWSGNAVSIRLLDPPLDRFLPTPQQIAEECAEAQSDENYDELFTLSSLRQRVLRLRAHASPSHRGCRLSLTHPEILRLQATAALEAVVELAKEGISTEVTFLVPLVSSGEEIGVLKKLITEIAAGVFSRNDRKIDYQLGAMIESPRATICAAEISRHVDVVAFGTNDLTRMTFGFTEDDIDAYLDCYMERGIFTSDPFVTIDQCGVGQLIKDAIRQMRHHTPNVEIGICGDHSADSESLRFFEALGANYAACELPFIERASRTNAELAAATA